MAGVTFSRSESPGAWYEFHVRGDSTVAHGFRVDGATTIGAHGRTAASVAQNSVERFEFIPGGFQAEYGEQTGGMVNVITKSGTNEIHGSYDAMFRPEGLASKVTGVQNQVKERQPGNTNFQEFAIGGPFVKNKVWYHFAMQYWQDERGSLLQPLVLHSDFTNFHTKFTYQQTEKNRWDLSVESDPFWQKNTVLTNDTAPEAQQYQDVSLYLVNLQHSHTFSKNTVLQSQAFLHHLGQTSGGMNVRNGGTMNDSNFRPFVTEVSAAGTYNSGYRNTRGQWADNRFRITEKLSTYQGQHNIKAGLDYSYLFGGRWSNIYGGAYNDRRPLGGTLTRTDTIQPNPTYDWTSNDVAIYLQDSWKVVPKVVIEAGIRFDYQDRIGEKNFAPRLGFSVDPTGRGDTRIYGSWGIFYQNLWAFSWAFDKTTIGQRQYTIVNPTAFFPNDPYKRLLIGTDLLTNTFTNRIASHYVNPYNYSWTVGYETKLPLGMKVDISYNENYQHDWLYTLRTATENILQSDNCGKDPVITDCGYYRGLEITLRKPFSRRFQFMQTYTRSRVKGLGDNQGQTFTVAQLPSAFGVQDWDEPNVFHTTAMYEFPYGILTSGVFRWASGRPYSINNAQVGTAILFVDRAGNPSYRNAQRLPPQSSIDLNFQKEFRLAEAHRVKLEFQVLNLANRVNVLRVQSAFTAAGTPTQVDFTRQFQIGAGYSW
jgi:hypothetical protein